ncbi:propanediol utilization protein [Rhodobacteraceae bacterium]|nr:propanediol utilization protein [Paracoccaceae bacterium]
MAPSSWCHQNVAGHFGEFLQGRIGPQGPVALITVPCPALSVDMWHRSGRSIQLYDPARVLPRHIGLRVQQATGLIVRGRIVVRTRMPVGGGAGASTAALTALLRLTRPDLLPHRLAHLVWQIEGASDPLAFAAPSEGLWASRQGRFVHPLPPVARFCIVGGFWGAPQTTNPNDDIFPDISDLIAPWTRAAATGNLAKLADIASTSARRTTLLRGPTCDPTEALAKQVGALGHLRAHTGSARGMIFAPDAPVQGAIETLRAAGYARVFSFRGGGPVRKDLP